VAMRGMIAATAVQRHPCRVRMEVRSRAV